MHQHNLNLNSLHVGFLKRNRCNKNIKESILSSLFSYGYKYCSCLSNMETLLPGLQTLVLTQGFPWVARKVKNPPALLETWV